MAEPVSAAIYTVGAYLGSATATATIGAALMTYSSVIAYTAVIGSTYALGRRQQKRARERARDAYNANLQDRTVMVRSAVAPSRLVLGRCRVSGQIAYIASTGDNKSKLVLLLALAGHEIDAIESIWLNDEQVIVDGNGYVTSPRWTKQDRRTVPASVIFSNGTAPLGSVLTIVPNAAATAVLADGRFVVGTVNAAANSVTLSGSSASYSGAATVHYQAIGGGATRVRVITHLGSPDQVVDPEIKSLLPDSWTDAHRGREIAYLACILDYDQDVFTSGIPQVSAVVRGAKVLDPRTATAAWSENPALLMRHYAGHRLGGRMTETALAATNDAWIAAANVCDQSVTFTVGGSSVTGARYTAGYMTTTDQRPRDVLDELAEAMAGKWAFIGNRLLVKAGAHVAPTLTLSDDDFADGPIGIQPKLPREQLANVVTGTFVDPAQGWQTVDMPRVDSTAWISEDGAELPLEIELTSVTASHRAQHLAAVLLRQARQGLTLTASFKLSAYRLELFDTVSISCSRYGWSGKVFEVMNRRWTLGGAIELTLRETDPSIWTVGGVFSTVDAAPNTNLPSPWAVPDVGPLTITSGSSELLRQADGTIVSRMRVAWPAIADEGVRQAGRVEVQYARVTNGTLEWQSAAPAGGADTSLMIDGVQDGGLYLVRARAANGVARGVWSVQAGHIVAGKTARPDYVAGLAAAVVTGGVRVSWTPNAEPDYLETELRVGDTWATSTRLYVGSASEYLWPWPASGSYKLWAIHRDTTRNESATAISVAVTVDSAMQVQWTALGGRPADSALLNAYVPTENLWTGSLATITGNASGAYISNGSYTDPRGGSSAVIVTLPSAGSYVYWRVFNQAGRQPGWYRITLKVLVAPGCDIVVAATDGADWNRSEDCARATSSATPNAWVTVTVRQYLGPSASGLYVVVGAHYKAGQQRFSVPASTAIAVADLVVVRDDATVGASFGTNLRDASGNLVTTVTTSLISAGAATDVIEASGADVDVAKNQATLPLNGIREIATITYTAPVDCAVMLRAQTEYAATAVSFLGAYVEIAITASPMTITPEGLEQFKNIIKLDQNKSAVGNAYADRKFSMTAGQTLTFRFYGWWNGDKDATQNDTCWMRKNALKLEAIKR